MKKFLSFVLFIFFYSTHLMSDERKIRLDNLFSDLKKNVPLSFEIEEKIWEIWSTHPSDKNLTEMLAKGSYLMDNQRLQEAKIIFSRVIEKDPEWAEAWNKRATVLYLIGDYKNSQRDIDKVLKLEKRHFGALAGQGLVNIELKNYEKAIKSYQRANEIHPSMKSPTIMIKQLKDLIKNNRFKMLNYLLPFIILILIVVFIHEYGHYYFARKYGVGVTDFSIGFGKEIFGWNDKSGTRWKICWIPLGGYVKFLEIEMYFHKQIKKN